MYIAYFDETGDDGFPKYSSELFVLTSIYSHYQSWKDNYQKNIQFRQYLKQKYGLPIKTEIHTKYLLLNKGFYKKLCLDNKKRLEMIIEIANFIGTLDIQSINVCIDKMKINNTNQKVYGHVLDVAVNFNVQRIENSIKKKDPNSKFLIITDEGRVGMMKKTTRKIQKINFIPSQFSGTNYRQEIKLLIEDPLPKNSNESYFIQIADFISYFVYLEIIDQKKWHNRLVWFTKNDLKEIIEKFKPILNLEASKNNLYGFVCYPK